MPVGKVLWLRAGTVAGKVALDEGDGVEQVFVIYIEPLNTMVDPTTLVKRSWMINLLSEAITHDQKVEIHHLDGNVAYVELRPKEGG